MRRHSSYLWLYTLIAVVAVGVGGYFLQRDFSLPGAGAEGEEPAAQRQRSGGTPGAPETATDQAAHDHILTCKAPDGSVFYTNAATCEGVDLENHVSVVDAYQPGAGQASAGERKCLSDEGPEAAGKQFLPMCREAYVKALKVEKFLRQADDPLRSPRAREYCDLITQGAKAGCPATSQLFCYLDVCQRLLQGE